MRRKLSHMGLQKRLNAEIWLEEMERQAQATAANEHLTLLHRSTIAAEKSANAAKDSAGTARRAEVVSRVSTIIAVVSLIIAFAAHFRAAP